MNGNDTSTAAGLASEDADDRAEAVMRKSMGTRPGALAYAALAVFTALAILGSIIAIQVAKDRAAAAVEANCESTDASNRVLVQIIGELTAPRVLGPTATPEEVAAQDQANMVAAENRAAKLAELQTLECSELGQTTDPEPIPVPGEEPPPIVVGPDGAIGPTGLTGLVGPTGRPGGDGVDGVPGVPGSPGADGTDGSDGTDGQPGDDGVDGAGGVDGTSGVDGTDGTGTQGPAGPTGPMGSAGQAPTLFTFEDGSTCTDPEGDGSYACTGGLLGGIIP